MAKKTWMGRAAGVLLPVSSLPSKYGIGNFGQAAREWVDFLVQAEQRYWQVLPLGPTSFGDSPYQSYSAFAGEPLYIDLDQLAEAGLLKKGACKRVEWGEDPSHVDYDVVRTGRKKLLRKAFKNFEDKKALEAFRQENAEWVEDYALYMALKDKNKGRPWTEWKKGLRLRDPAALEECREKYKEDVDYYVFTQYLFFQQWGALKEYANQRGVKIIGDAPIYVAMDSADVWAQPGLFQLDEKNVPTEVSGCPPDAFSADGQLWGNPLYRWDVMREDGYAWWMERVKANLSMYDVLRIDHFRGLESYYAIPYGEETAKNGRWRKGPGMDFVKAIAKAVEEPAIIAEDLGLLTPAVHRLLKSSGYPGMKVLQFAFSAGEESTYLPHNLPTHCVVYTGTHDNDTTRGWLSSAGEEDLRLALDYLGLEDAAGGTWAFIRAALSSVADLAIVPFQDYLDLGSEARINTPSTVGGRNWRWRMAKDCATKKLAKKMARLATIYGRARDLGGTTHADA